MAFNFSSPAKKKKFILDHSAIARRYGITAGGPPRSGPPSSKAPAKKAPRHGAPNKAAIGRRLAKMQAGKQQKP